MNEDWSEWKASHLENGGPGERQWPGWYATRSRTVDKHYLETSFRGPFDTEEVCRTFCEIGNADP